MLSNYILYYGGQFLIAVLFSIPEHSLEHP